MRFWRPHTDDLPTIFDAEVVDVCARLGFEVNAGHTLNELDHPI
jgi:hypothetical protein